MARALPGVASAPLITIGVTCFNAEGTVERAVRSALEQDWPITEIIVVDDMSTDGSWAVLESLQTSYPELRLIRHDRNCGYPGAVNTIIASALGEFVALFDDDDDSRRDRVSKQFKRIVEYETCQGAEMVLCYSNRDVVRVGQDRVDHVAEAIGRVSPEPNGPMVAEFVFGHLVDRTHNWGMFGSCTLMARNAVLNKLSGLDEDFRRCAEWDLAVRAAFEGAHFIAVNEPLITQYKTKTNDKAGKIPLTYALKLRYKHAEYLRQHGVYWGAIAMAHARFFDARGHHWRRRFYHALALALFPWSVTRMKINKFIETRRTSSALNSRRT